MAQQDEFIRTALRVPPELHKAIHEAAKKAGRTFNAEILSRLQRTFDDKPAINGIGMRELFEKLTELEEMVRTGVHVPFGSTPAGQEFKRKHEARKAKEQDQGDK